jgi:hypothetical protein
MLLSMHVHFLTITYIHISCIFSELVYQRASVCTISISTCKCLHDSVYIYSIHMKV